MVSFGWPAALLFPMTRRNEVGEDGWPWQANWNYIEFNDHSKEILFAHFESRKKVTDIAFGTFFLNAIDTCVIEIVW